MATLRKLTPGKPEYSPSSSNGVVLMKRQIAAEGANQVQTDENSVAANTSTLASGSYNPFEEASVSTEADSPTDLKKKAVGDAKPQGIASAAKGLASSVKDSVVGFASSKAVQDVRKMAAKTADFAKSSVAKVNDMPENVTQKEINEKIATAKDDPKSLAKLVQDGAKSAGKATAIAGISILSLPIAAAAIVANRKFNIHTTKNGADQLKNELIKLELQIKKAREEGDTDKEADLLILQRNTDRAYMRLKYGLSKRVNMAEKHVED